MLVGDLVLDQNWARWTKSSEPDLNRRGDQLIGRVLTVVDAIERGGRGSVRAADGVWPAEGNEAAAGAQRARNGLQRHRSDRRENLSVDVEYATLKS